ncbi:glutathione S-transferase [Prochlorococcus marinus str. MU1404]|uniref:glutathione S-transferase n=1 Tax=Prochlorococcus marinus TaxID=1219 RepID=UPI001ADCFAFC|nr:glutathione S-transferase [Prochlorococcus marinus]MBO8229834.1 glutathione S-transferase [Prochlorococcus marinus XMU1404]MBW3072911.1 glutathione S-transferase [Prochlorococcus marinus str. MU1404]MCR8545830.1 glutathione S-transferase [Prochlorococcus marinus CUG1432]
MTKDILYSFRRCPYAIRARWALLICEIKVEIREIDLKNKPLDFLKKSKTKTVPILIKKNSEVIEESLEIILWALSESKKENIKLIYFPDNKKEAILEIINENDNEFKYHLDRFKYAPRYQNSNEEFHFTNAIKFIKKWNKLLAENKYFFGDKPTIADWSIWPFIRQFKIACESQKRTNYLEPSIRNWLNTFENNRKFKSLMYKYDLWEQYSRKNYFPYN